MRNLIRVMLPAPSGVAEAMVVPIHPEPVMSRRAGRRRCHDVVGDRASRGEVRPYVAIKKASARREAGPLLFSDESPRGPTSLAAEDHLHDRGRYSAARYRLPI